MPYLADFDPESLKAWLAERSEPWAKPFRADQLLTHYYHKLTPTYAEMTDLPVAMREALRGGPFSHAIPGRRLTIPKKTETIVVKPCLCDLPIARVRYYSQRFARRERSSV